MLQILWKDILEKHFCVNCVHSRPNDQLSASESSQMNETVDRTLQMSPVDMHLLLEEIWNALSTRIPPEYETNIKQRRHLEFLSPEVFQQVLRC